MTLHKADVLLQVWEGKIISNKDNRELIIGPVEYNVDLTPGKDLQVWFNAYGDEFGNAKYSFESKFSF